MLALVASVEGLFKKPEDLLKQKPQEEVDDWQPVSILTEEVAAKSKTPEVEEDMLLDLTPEEMEMSFIQMLGEQNKSTSTEKKAATKKTRRVKDHTEFSRAKACLTCAMAAFDPTSCSAGQCDGDRWCWHATHNPKSVALVQGSHLAKGSVAAKEDHFVPCI